MQVDYLIIGQGICGTMLSWFLHKEGKSFLVIDDERHSSSSQIAAGIINPVTGRRYVYTWMIDIVMPFALDTYKEIGDHLNIQTVFSKSIIDFFLRRKCAMHLLTALPRMILTCTPILIKIILINILNMILVVAKFVLLI